jgi:hypothetical protein
VDLARHVHLSRAAALAAVLLEACALDRPGEVADAAAHYLAERQGWELFCVSTGLPGAHRLDDYPGRHVILRADRITRRLKMAPVGEAANPYEVADYYRLLVEGLFEALLNDVD